MKKGQKMSEQARKNMSIAAKKVIHKSTQGYQKGHGLLGDNPTSKGKNWKLSQETKDKMSKNMIGNTRGKAKKGKTGYKFTDEQRNNLRNNCQKGENHYAWIKDRSKVQKRDHNSTKEFVYTEWRDSIFKRDKYKCRLCNEECSGQLEAHHIFRWKDYPELRYLVTNGITLCHFHHPRRMEEEKRLIPIFQELVSVSN